MLQLENVSKQSGQAWHIRQVNLSLDAKGVNVLLGPTLSGKTSLMRLMAGLDRPTEGRIFVDGEDVTGMSVRERNVAMVYQQFINYPAMTVYENIASPMRIKGVDKAIIDRRVHEAAELLKLEGFLDRTPLNLSGGQQQRTALARALVKDAKLVLLDEPLANLDYKLREELRVELPRLFAETGTVFVYATTEPHEALLLGGRTATLHEGRVTQFGPTIEVYREPRDLLTAATFSDPPLNRLDVVISGGRVMLGDRALFELDQADGNYVLALRPHHVRLGGDSHESDQAGTPVSLRAVVGTSEITGSETYLHLSVDDRDWVLLTHGVHRISHGEPIDVQLDPRDCFLFDDQGELVHAPRSREEAA